MKKHELETIVFSIKPVTSSPLTTLYGVTEINGKDYWNQCYINGEHLGSDGMEFSEFEDMLKKPGNYFPFCCSYCGIPECSNIFIPIRCFHKADEIILVIREPLTDQCQTCDCFMEKSCKFDYDKFFCSMPPPIYRAHRFSKSQMQDALQRVYSQINEIKNGGSSRT